MLGGQSRRDRGKAVFSPAMWQYFNTPYRNSNDRVNANRLMLKATDPAALGRASRACTPPRFYIPASTNSYGNLHLRRQLLVINQTNGVSENHNSIETSECSNVRMHAYGDMVLQCGEVVRWLHLRDWVSTGTTNRLIEWGDEP